MPAAIGLFFINQNYYGGALSGFSLGLMVLRLLMINHLIDDDIREI